MMRWISVKERLPEKSGIYLAISTKNYVNTFLYSDKHKMFNVTDGFSREEAYKNEIKVKYWMPLPEAP